MIVISRVEAAERPKEIKMMVGKIRIETKSGKMIERNAVVTDWIDNDGRQSSRAQVGRYLYKVIRRDSLGPVFKVV